MSCNISIFAKRAFLNTNPYNEFKYEGKAPKYGYLQRVSSMIRGDQIADYIGARFNPESDYENDVCIYVKPQVKKDGDFVFEGRAWLDIIDGHNLGQLAIKYPEVGIIVCSQADYDTMTSSIPNRVVVIPQQHCNFERVQKPLSKEVKTVGIIGTRGAFPFIPKTLRPFLEELGIELLEYSKFYTRQDVIDFYMRVDLQVVYRPYKKRLSNPLKIVNASAFGVPTVALDEKAFGEVEGCYLPINTPQQLVWGVNELISSPKTYAEYHDRCLVKAEEYHIENIGRLYQNLCTI